MVCWRGEIGQPGRPEDWGLVDHLSNVEPPVRDSNGVVSAVLMDDNDSWWQNRMDTSPQSNGLDYSGPPYPDLVEPGFRMGGPLMVKQS